MSKKTSPGWHPIQDLPRETILDLFEVSEHAATALASGYATLTDREGEILPLIGRGITQRAIAEQLGISLKTLDIHRANLCRKLGVRLINLPRVHFLAKALGFRRVPRPEREAATL